MVATRALRGTPGDFDTRHARHTCGNRDWYEEYEAQSRQTEDDMESDLMARNPVRSMQKILGDEFSVVNRRLLWCFGGRQCWQVCAIFDRYQRKLGGQFMNVEDTGLLEVVAVMSMHVGFVPWRGGK